MLQPLRLGCCHGGGSGDGHLPPCSPHSSVAGDRGWGLGSWVTPWGHGRVVWVEVWVPAAPAAIKACGELVLGA